MTNATGAPVRLHNVVDGAPTPAADGRTMDVVDPATGDVYATAPLSGPADLDAAYRAASGAFATWGRTTPAERQRLLLRLADALEADAERFAAVESTDTGKPLRLLMADELPACIDQLRFFAGAARVLEGRSAGEYAPGMTSWIRREPVGVIGQVTPWNYPLMMAIWKIGPALAAGNTLVLKPSDTTPASTVLLATVAAGILPAGVLNVVTGDRATGAALVAHPTPAMVAITGSVQAGVHVAKAAADGVKRVHLELGGKAPVLVFDDADVDAAAETIAFTGYYNGGQDCTAATRVLVTPGVHDAFVAALTECARRTVTGPPDDPAAAYGPLNSQQQLQAVGGYVDRLPAHARVQTGGHTVGSRGFFYAPTVVSGLRQDDEA
ncbi:MAG: betaine-aldehyde dehydrogenase, partial [Frankiaceae bacterium]|nr:betaine-aldehyde dehydrogenase [Frankiaceae bacterium]